MDHILEILQDRETPSPYGVVLSESMHEKLRSIIESEVNPRRKLNILTGTVRQMVKNGEDTGLESDKPKKGSSRAVFFPKEPKHITIDDQPAQVHSVVKVAFPGALDAHTGDESLLGEHQNRMESDNYLNRTYGVLHEDSEKSGSFHYNENGVLPPHFGAHEDHHWLEMGRVSKLNAKDFKEATKTPEFPKGITHDDFFHAVGSHYAESNGRKYPYMVNESLQDHPLVQRFNYLSGDADIHPADFVKQNMGIWTHPITGKKHIVASDFGNSTSISKLYSTARDKLAKRSRGY